MLSGSFSRRVFESEVPKRFRQRGSATLNRAYSRRVYTYVRQAGEISLEKFRTKQPPLCFKILRNFYHKYGLKHVVLIFVLFVYCCFGALVFVLIEEPHQEWMKTTWKNSIAANRSIFVNQLIKHVFNNSRFLIFIRQKTSTEVNELMQLEMMRYEKLLNIKYTEMKMEWDFGNAMLYAGTIFTTIGYGHIYPHTSAGKILTMIYALFGIPLVLLILQDLGKMLTVSLKFPWFQFKRGFRRALRYCTKQSLKEIREIEIEERANLPIFDLPILVAIGLVVGWIFLCSATFCIWETQWTYLEAFYFFFISLSTIGLGDLVLQKPKMLLMMFGLIFIGLSLVSMCVNLLQMHLEATYEAGNKGFFSPLKTSRRSSSTNVELPRKSKNRLGRRASDGTQVPKRTVLGVFATADQNSNPANFMITKIESRSCQTNVSYPAVRRVFMSADGSVQWLSSLSTYSVQGSDRSTEDVTQLVESDAEVGVLFDLGEHFSESENLPGGNSTPASPSKELVVVDGEYDTEDQEQIGAVAV